MSTIPKFSDLVESKVLDGDKVRIDDLLGKRLIVIGATSGVSQYQAKGCKSYAKVQFYYADDETQTHHIFFTGSNVIQDQIGELMDKFKADDSPFEFETVVNKVGKYYSFT